MKTIVTWIQNKFDFGGANRYSNDDDIGVRYLRLQVDNHARLGLPLQDLILGTNFDFSYNGVRAYPIDTDITWSAFATKLPAALQLISMLDLNENLWIHDADVYQLLPFSFPDVADIGYVRHSVPTRMKPQGGCVYVRPSGYDILEQIAGEMQETKETKEERFMVGFYKRPEYINRRTWLGYEYNLFRQSDFNRKYRWAKKPILCVHFHLEYTSTWNCFVEGKNRYNVKIVPEDLRALFDKHGFRPTIKR